MAGRPHLAAPPPIHPCQAIEEHIAKLDTMDSLANKAAYLVDVSPEERAACLAKLPQKERDILALLW